MLKISVIDSVRQRRLVVEGKLIPPWTSVLRSACDKAKADLRGRELVIEMKQITVISDEGKNVILGLIKSRIRFRSGGVLTKYVLKELTRCARKNLRIGEGDCRGQFPVRREESIDKEETQ